MLPAGYSIKNKETDKWILSPAICTFYPRICRKYLNSIVNGASSRVLTLQGDFSWKKIIIWLCNANAWATNTLQLLYFNTEKKLDKFSYNLWHFRWQKETRLLVGWKKKITYSNLHITWNGTTALVVWRWASVRRSTRTLIPFTSIISLTFFWRSQYIL